jgi:hypothetical protein
MGLPVFDGSWNGRSTSNRRQSRLASGGVDMNKGLLVAVGLALLAPAAFAQTAGKLDPGSRDEVMRHQQMEYRQVLNATRAIDHGERQAWLNSLANLDKLRTKLAEAWQSMGMSPQGATIVANAYDPNLATRTHHTSLRGKSDEEVAQMIQSAIMQKNYLAADQLLIDYERTMLRIGDAQ